MAGEDLLERVHVEAFRVVGDAQHACSRLLHRDECAHVGRRLGDDHVPGTDDGSGHQVDRLTTAVGDDDLVRVTREASCGPTLCELLTQRPETVRITVGQRFRARAGEHLPTELGELTDRKQISRRPTERKVDVVGLTRKAPCVGDDLGQVAAVQRRQNGVLPASVAGGRRGRRLTDEGSAAARGCDKPLACQPLVRADHRQVVDARLLGEGAGRRQLGAGGKRSVLYRGTDQCHELRGDRLL